VLNYWYGDISDYIGRPSAILNGRRARLLARSLLPSPPSVLWSSSAGPSAASVSVCARGPATAAMVESSAAGQEGRARAPSPTVASGDRDRSSDHRRGRTDSIRGPTHPPELLGSVRPPCILFAAAWLSSRNVSKQGAPDTGSPSSRRFLGEFPDDLCRGEIAATSGYVTEGADVLA